MFRTHLAAAVVLAAFALPLAACGGSSPQADEAAIRDANKKWLELIVAKDAKTIANEIYAEDGAMLPPNAPKAAGREAIQKGWDDMFKTPGVTLTFETERFVIAKSGDLAVDIGTYKFAADGGINDTGKSVVTWEKKDGKWQVLTDMFSSDAPPPPPAPAATAPAGSGAVPGPAETGPAPTPAPTAPTPTTPPAQ